MNPTTNARRPGPTANAFTGASPGEGAAVSFVLDGEDVAALDVR